MGSIMKRAGFTLLDLIICVVIVGILCAVAIPVFNRHMDSSKMVEAKINLSLIGRGAFAFFSEEHSCGNGVNGFTHQYPSRTDICTGKDAGGLDAIGGMPYSDESLGRGSSFTIKHDPSLEAKKFATRPWSDLKFSISSPFYFSYNYQGGSRSGSGTVTVKNPENDKIRDVVLGPSYFNATASACFNYNICASKQTCDYGFVIAGGPRGSQTPILDNSDFSIHPDCGKALLGSTIKGLSKKGITLDNY